MVEPAEPLLVKTLLPLLEMTLTVMTLIMVGIAAMWALHFGYRTLKAVMVGYPTTQPVPAKIEPKLTFTRPEVFSACQCAACQAGWARTKPELTPPTLQDWDGWRKYGLITDKG